MDQQIRPVVIALLGLAFAMTASETKGDEFYYAMIFGSQSKPKLLQYTHTWATFIRAVGEGPDANNYSVYQHTISWLPQSFDIRTWSLLPEPGVNLDLYRTLEAVYRDHEHVTMWGRPDPPGGLRAFARREANSRQRGGGIPGNQHTAEPASQRWHPCGGRGRSCLRRGHYPLIRIGKPASRDIAREVMTRSVFDQWQGDNSWLIPRLGLDRYPIEFVLPQQIPNGMASSAVARTEAELDQPSPGHLVKPLGASC